MFKKYLKRFGGIAFFTGVVFFGLLLLKNTELQHTTQQEKTVTVFPRSFRKPLSTSQETLTDFHETDFYQTIVDNNLFRPLGWTPPRPKEPYRLLGTLIPTDENIPKQAILQRTTRTTYTVKIGDKLDAETILIDIQPKQVTLEKAGHQRTLKLSTTTFLK